jgi:hypothetical protein
LKAPDLHKKRFRYNKYFTEIVTEETYKKWKLDNPHLKKKINSFASFRKYWRRIADCIVEEVCTNPFGVKLPYYCGELSIKFANMDLKPINKRASINNNTSVPHLNWNSSERVGKLVWNVNKSAKFNSMIMYYGFKGTREFNQNVNKALMETPELFRVYSANVAVGKDIVKYNLKLKRIEEQGNSIKST